MLFSHCVGYYCKMVQTFCICFACTCCRKKTGQNSGGSDSAVSVLQRRKRFSAMPNLAKPRVSIASSRAAVRVPKSPPPKVCNLPSAETVAPTPKDNGAAQGSRSPRWRRPSGGGKPSKIQGKLPPLSPSVPASGKQPPLPSPVPTPEPVPQGRRGKEASASPQCTVTSDLEPSSQEENPLPDPAVSATPSPSAKPETKTPSSLSPSAHSNPPYDRERIAKLRELIKQEQRKRKVRKIGWPNLISQPVLICSFMAVEKVVCHLLSPVGCQICQEIVKIILSLKCNYFRMKM